MKNKIYDFPNFDPKKLDPQNVDRLALEKVPFKSLVLDVGCATGFMGKYLIENKNCKVYGVEMDSQEAKAAGRNLNKVFIGNIEESKTILQLKRLADKNKFDVILATSIIEHLVNPEKFLTNLKELVKPSGIIIVSTPNIAHWSIRLSLIKGKFDYVEYGTLDKTHLHFYTIGTFKKIFKKNGLNIKDFNIDPVGGGYPKISNFFAKIYPNLFAYQMLAVVSFK